MNNLTEIMIRDGIINIHMDPHGSFQLRMKGDILGTGRTVDEAYQNAMRDKLAQMEKTTWTTTTATTS